MYLVRIEVIHVNISACFAIESRMGNRGNSKANIAINVKRNGDPLAIVNLIIVRLEAIVTCELMKFAT